jgi:type II secretory pathway pseudopilin PulG
MNKFNQKGFGLIEIIIAATIGVAVLLSVATYLNFSLRVASEDINQIEALYLAKSSLEQARSVRDEEGSGNKNYGYENLYSLVIGSQYHFEADASSPPKWMPVPGSQTIGRYTIQVVLSNVYRDAISDNIVSAGGVLDPGTLKITSNVTYPARGGIKQMEIYEYLTNFK